VQVAGNNTGGGRKGCFLFNATGLPQITSLDQFVVQRAGGTGTRSTLLYAILGTNEFLGSVNNWIESEITWNNAPANNNPVNTNRAFVAYPGESLIKVGPGFQASGNAEQVCPFLPTGLAETDHQAILTALNTGDRKLTLGLQYNSGNENNIPFRSRENGDGSFGARLYVTFGVVINTVKVNQTGDQLQLTGSGGFYVSETFHVLSSPNVAEPLSNWTPVATNQFQAGIFSVSIPFDPQSPPRFYRLQVQP